MMPSYGASLLTDASCNSTGDPESPSCDQGFEADYSYEITLTQNNSDSSVFTFVLENTSSQTNPDALIDGFWFNTNPDLDIGTDIVFSNFNPNTWTVTKVPLTGPGSNVQFDFAGDPDSPADRLGVGETLEFTIDLADSLGTDPDDYSDIFFTAEESTGQGIGGGQDSGQVAVSFQQLDDGEKSDLLTSNWRSAGGGGAEIPEPSSMLGLVAFGLMGAGSLFKGKVRN
jgi:hypothetical protein